MAWLHPRLRPDIRLRLSRCRPPPFLLRPDSRAPYVFSLLLDVQGIATKRGSGFSVWGELGSELEMVWLSGLSDWDDLWWFEDMGFGF